jgi:hypothetical protein
MENVPVRNAPDFLCLNIKCELLSLEPEIEFGKTRYRYVGAITRANQLFFESQLKSGAEFVVYRRSNIVVNECLKCGNCKVSVDVSVCHALKSVVFEPEGWDDCEELQEIGLLLSGKFCAHYLSDSLKSPKFATSLFANYSNFLSDSSFPLPVLVGLAHLLPDVSSIVGLLRASIVDEDRVEKAFHLLCSLDLSFDSLADVLADISEHDLDRMIDDFGPLVREIFLRKDADLSVLGTCPCVAPCLVEDRRFIDVLANPPYSSHMPILNTASEEFLFDLAAKSSSLFVLNAAARLNTRDDYVRLCLQTEPSDELAFFTFWVGNTLACENSEIRNHARGLIRRMWPTNERMGPELIGPFENALIDSSATPILTEVVDLALEYPRARSNRKFILPLTENLLSCDLASNDYHYELYEQLTRFDPLPSEDYGQLLEQLAQPKQGELLFIQFEYFLLLATRNPPAIPENSASLALCDNWMKRQQRSRIREVLKFCFDIVEIEKIAKQLPFLATFSRILEVYIPAMSDLAKWPVVRQTSLCVWIIRGTCDASYLMFLNDHHFRKQFLSSIAVLKGVNTIGWTGVHVKSSPMNAFCDIFVLPFLNRQFLPWLRSLAADRQTTVIKNLRHLMYTYPQVQVWGIKQTEGSVFKNLLPDPKIRREWGKFVTELIREFLAERDISGAAKIREYVKWFAAEFRMVAGDSEIEFASIEPLLKFGIAILNGDVAEFPNVPELYQIMNRFQSWPDNDLLARFFQLFASKGTFNENEVLAFVKSLKVDEMLKNKLQLLKVFALDPLLCKWAVAETLAQIRRVATKSGSPLAEEVCQLLIAAADPH